MRLRVAAVGQRMPGWVTSGWQEYARRFPRHSPLELIEIPMPKRTRNANRDRLVEAEGERLLASAPAGAERVALDIGGQAWSTAELADCLRGWLAGGRDVHFMVGGPDGLSGAVRAAADRCWSLGPLTLPHPLVRVLLAEQLYRAWSLVHNHPYHRE